MTFDYQPRPRFSSAYIRRWVVTIVAVLTALACVLFVRWNINSPPSGRATDALADRLYGAELRTLAQNLRTQRDSDRVLPEELSALAPASFQGRSISMSYRPQFATDDPATNEPILFLMPVESQLNGFVVVLWLRGQVQLWDFDQVRRAAARQKDARLLHELGSGTNE
jgi:hypothetical protein